jgi:tetratricopeptide (TPR) repeat protein
VVEGGRWSTAMDICILWDAGLDSTRNEGSGPPYGCFTLPECTDCATWESGLNPHARWLAAEAAADRKNWVEAEAGYRSALALDAGYVPALIGLSTVLTRNGRHREAHEVVLTAVAQDTQEPPLLFALGQRLRFFHEFEALERCLSNPRLAAEAPLTVVAKSVVMLSSVGANEAATRLADAALRRDPHHAASLYVRGNLHQFDGQALDAERCYEAALQSDPRLFQSSWMLASVRTQTPESNHVQRLRRQLKEATPGKEGEAYLAYGLHKELHDLGDYEVAWEALEHGCRVKRKLGEYREDDVKSLVRQTMATCTPEFLEQRSSVEQPSVPIFIVGMHRSGTTLLERILAGHPDVGDAGETRAFDAQMELAADYSIGQGADAEMARRASRLDYDVVARGYARHVSWLSRGKPFFTEKLPMNFWNVGFIAKALPQARILHMVRNPMDTCFSNLRTLFAGVALYSYTQEELARFYLQYRRMMDHWRSIAPGLILDVNYDTLVANLGEVVDQVVAHCGLRPCPGLGDVSRPGGRVATASASTARKGILRDRGQLWRKYERHLRPMQRILEPLDS